MMNTKKIKFSSSRVKKWCHCAGEALARYRLIGEGDRILVAVSGGKDSMVLLHLLQHWRASAPVRFEVAAATFDPGFFDFGAERIGAYCRERKWEHHILRLPIPEIIEEKKFGASPCVLCSRLRRGKLYGLAAELGCNKLALGQHLDDVIASFWMSVCRGQGLRTMAPLVRPGDPAAPTVIRPLALTPESLIRDVAAELELPAAGKCPYENQLESGDRAYFRGLTEHLAERIPGLRGNLIRSLGHIEVEHLLDPTARRSD